MLIGNNSIHKVSASREVTMDVDAKSAYSEEQRVDKLEIEMEGNVDAHGTETGRTTDTSNIDGISGPPIKKSSEVVLDEMVSEIAALSSALCLVWVRVASLKEFNLNFNQ